MSGWFRRTCSAEALMGDLKSPLFWRNVFLELIASTMLMTCILFVLITNNTAEYVPNTTHIGLAATLLVMVIVEAFHPVNGTNINPAISIPLFFAGRITLTKAIAYTIAQCVAAPISAAVGYYLTPEPARLNFTSLMPDETMTMTQAISMETFFTFILLFVIMSITDPDNRPALQLPGLIVGAVIGLGILLAGTHSKGLMNPIVSLAPAIITGNFTGHIIYWIGPCVGGTLGAVFYNLMKLIKDKYDPKERQIPIPSHDRRDNEMKDPHLIEGLLDNRSTPPLKYNDN